MLIARLLAICLISTSMTIPGTDNTGAARAALQAQVQAWNRKDLEAALSFYWDSPEMMWVNRKGISFGRTDFAAAMRSDFADLQKMGIFTSKVLQAREIRSDLVLLVIDWRIEDSSGHKQTGGISSQLRQRFPDGWKAVFKLVLLHFVLGTSVPGKNAYSAASTRTAVP